MNCSGLMTPGVVAMLARHSRTLCFTSLPSVCLRPSVVENGGLCGLNISLVMITTSTALHGLCIMRTLHSVSSGFPRVFWGSQGLAHFHFQVRTIGKHVVMQFCSGVSFVFQPLCFSAIYIYFYIDPNNLLS